MIKIATCSVSFGLLLAVFAGANSHAEEPHNPALRLALGSTTRDWDNTRQVDVTPSAIDSSALRLAPERHRLDALRDRPVGVDTPTSRSLEFTFTARRYRTGLDLDLALAPRAGLTVGPEGGQLRSAGAEIRVGDLGDDLEHMVRPFEGATWDAPAWYFFLAADGSALTWTPEVQNVAAREGWRFQDERVLVGDHQIGVSMEASNIQASVSFTNRDVSTGSRSYEENFLGAAVTLKR